MTAAALYVRVSTGDQTVENQVRELKPLALARGFEPFVYEETASGVKARPVLDQVLRDARSGKVRAVLVVALDRFARSMQGIVRIVLEFEHVNARVISLREPWLDIPGPARPLLVAVFGWVAEQEREMMIARSKAGQDRARAEGARIGRPPANPILLAAAARRVAGGASIRYAAAAFGVNASSVGRYIRALRRKSTVGLPRTMDLVSGT